MIRKALASRPLAAAGIVSYSFYLWHQPLAAKIPASWLNSHGFWFALAGIGVAFVWAAAVAGASYFVVERPFNRLGHRISAIRPRTAT